MNKTDLMDIATLAGVFEKTSELQEYCNMQYITIQKLNERIKILEDENVHLKELLAQSVPLINKPDLKLPSNEKAICEIQIKKLKDTAMDRELTLEETKRFDLLTKNLLLITEAEAENDSNFGNLTSLDDSTLLELASLPDPEVKEE